MRDLYFLSIIECLRQTHNNRFVQILHSFFKPARLLPAAGLHGVAAVPRFIAVNAPQGLAASVDLHGGRGSVSTPAVSIFRLCFVQYVL